MSDETHHTLFITGVTCDVTWKYDCKRKWTHRAVRSLWQYGGLVSVRKVAMSRR